MQRGACWARGSTGALVWLEISLMQEAGSSNPKTDSKGQGRLKRPNSQKSHQMLYGWELRG